MDCDCCYSLQQTTDGGFILGGWSYSFGAGECDFWMVKTDVLGSEEWNLAVGGEGFEHGQSVCQTDDGGFVMTGHTTSFGAGGIDIWLVRLEGLLLSVTMTPLNPPIIIPAAGGSFDFLMNISNNSAGFITFDTWIDVTLPSGHNYGPLSLCNNMSLPANAAGARYLTQNIPPGAPQGGYHYNAYVGVYPDSMYSKASFSFSKTGSTYGSDRTSNFDWIISCSDPETHTALVSITPFLHPSNPNPFNSSTSIRFTLPTASWVKLEIFDLNGRRIHSRGHEAVLLVNCWLDAGLHDITFNARDLPSGMYFARLKAGQFVSTQKMVLIK